MLLQTSSFEQCNYVFHFLKEKGIKSAKNTENQGVAIKGSSDIQVSDPSYWTMVFNKSIANSNDE
jgi:hypothetical protein